MDGNLMAIANFFQLGPTPLDALHGTYNLSLVTMSYIIAVLASCVALDFAGRVRHEKKGLAKNMWLLGGACAMGAGIWSMHFIGMLAFSTPLPMHYSAIWKTA